MDEEVLAVKRTTLFGKNDEKAFNGFKKEGEFSINDEVIKKLEFKLRKVSGPTQPKPIEEDTTYKQIIPYLIITHNNKVFCYQRTPKGGEQRLHNKYSIGVGGHINPIDIKDKNEFLIECMKREFEEEVEYHGKIKTKVIGYINDDSGEVEKVHFGVVFQIEIESENIKLREEELTDGKLSTWEEVTSKKEYLEMWSKIVLNAQTESKGTLIK